MISQRLLYSLKRLSLFGLLIILMLAFTGMTQAEPIYSSDIPAVRSSLVFATIYPHDVAQTLTINNMGTAPLNITTSITPASSHFTVLPTSITVASNNGHQALTVTCQGNAVGTYTGTLTVSHDASGSPATYPLSCTVSRAGQTITFPPLPTKTYGDPDFTISATGGGSGNLVNFNVITGSCTVSGNTVHIMGAGSCTIRANQQGNDNYNPSPSVSQTFVIRENSPNILPLCKLPYVLKNGKCVRQPLPELPKCGPGEELKGDICIPTYTE